MPDISYYFLIFFCAYLPFQIAFNPLEGIDLASARVLAILIFTVWLTESLWQKRFFLPKSKNALFLFSFLFLAFFSLFWVENINWGFRKAVFLLSFFPLYLVTFASSSTIARKKILIKVLALGGALLAIIGLLQFSSQYVFGISTAYAWWGKHLAPIFLGNSFSASVLENPSWLVNAGGKDFFRVISIFPDPHMLAFYLNMLLPFATVLAMQGRSKKENALWMIAALAILLASLLTFSRGGYLGLATAFIILSVPFLSSLGIKKIIPAAALLLFICGPFLLFPNPITSRLTSIFDFSEGSNLGRIETWSRAVEIIRNNPLGVGLGNYALAIKPSADYREPIYAHSVYLDIASEIGIIGLVFWIFMLSGVMISFIKKRKESLLYFAGFASLASFVIHSLVENPLFSIHILSLLLIIMALSESGDPELKNV